MMWVYTIRLANHLDVLLRVSQVLEISQILSQRVQELEDQRQTSNSDLVRTATDFCKADDKLLVNLQRLASEIETARPEENEHAVRLRTLCAKYEPLALLLC